MLIKNQIYTAEVTDYTVQGQGIAHVEGCAVFVPDAIVGERCQIRITKAAKTWAAGQIARIEALSPHRVNRECPIGKRCGGCAFQHMDYEEECRLKADRVRQALNRLGGENLEKVDILPAPDTHCYRNKAQYPVTMVKGRAVAGFYREGSHEVMSTSRCGILPPEMDQVRDAVTAYMDECRVSAYDEKTGRGLIRHIYVRKGWVSGELFVCIAANGNRLPHWQDLCGRLQKISGFATLVLAVNKKPGNVVLGDTFVNLHGPGWIEDRLCGLRFRLSPRSFYQVNHAQAENLYDLAIRAARIQKTDLVMDLYCGVGTITLIMAKAAGQVIGVELEPQAVADAQDNARRNGIENVEFFCGDAGKAALELERRGIRPDVVVVDPPRKGLSADVIAALDKMSPRRLVYISCDPATLARDVALLKEKNYSLHFAQAVDMFPRTAHIETVVLLSRETNPLTVEVRMEVETGEVKEHPTYKRIQEYVQEKYGFKVHTAYIAEVKRMVGLDMHKAPNAVEQRKHEYHPCPPEKVEAIKDALRHFGLISE